MNGDLPSDASVRQRSLATSRTLPPERLSPSKARSADSKHARLHLALAVHRREKGAFERLVSEYQDSLFDYAAHMLKEPSDAQEVTQDVFLRAHRALTSSYDEDRCRMLQLRPWLFRIARNLSLNHLRRRRSVAAEPLPESDAYHDPSLRSRAETEKDPRLAALERSLRKLNGSSREAVRLRFMEGLSYAEIAAVLGGSEASARGKVFRAVAELRATLTNSETIYAM